MNDRPTLCKTPNAELLFLVASDIFLLLFCIEGLFRLREIFGKREHLRNFLKKVASGGLKTFREKFLRISKAFKQ
jgi:hypothetical protein